MNHYENRRGTQIIPREDIRQGFNPAAGEAGERRNGQRAPADATRPGTAPTKGTGHSLALDEEIDLILQLVESDRPKSLQEKIAEYLARPPQPVLRFYGEFGMQLADGKRHVLFAVRNGLPIPLLYGIYVKANYDTLADYIEKTDHIGPFSIDDWRLTLDDNRRAQIEIITGLVPLEITTDRVLIAV